MLVAVFKELYYDFAGAAAWLRDTRVLLAGEPAAFWLASHLVTANRHRRKPPSAAPESVALALSAKW